MVSLLFSNIQNTQSYTQIGHTYSTHTLARLQCNCKKQSGDEMCSSTIWSVKHTRLSTHSHTHTPVHLSTYTHTHTQPLQRTVRSLEDFSMYSPTAINYCVESVLTVTIFCSIVNSHSTQESLPQFRSIPL